jgi:hypothetical protein
MAWARNLKVSLSAVNARKPKISLQLSQNPASLARRPTQGTDNFRCGRLKIGQVSRRKCLHRERPAKPKHVDGADDPWPITQRDRD